LSDIPEARPEPGAERRLLDDGRRARAMSWVMAVMVFLTVLAAALGLATRHVARGIDRQLGGRLVVQLVSASEADAARLAATLRDMPGVRAVRPVPRAELAELVRPWLGDAGLDADLPMPAMIDVDLTETSDATVAAVEARARALTPGARVDRSAGWLASVRATVVGIAWGAGGVVLLVASATTAIVLLAARAGLDTHRDTIEVLHMLGSTDRQVARLFQRRIALDTLVGGALGAALALGGVALAGWQVSALEAGLVSGVMLTPLDWLLLASLPLLFALLATIAARVAVLSALKRAL
jgi:cell division transport system permease protein